MQSGTRTVDDAASGQVRVIAIGDHEIHAREHGTGDDVVVLLHGLSGSWRWWSRNVAELSERRRLIVPDLIGFGRSTTPRRLPRIDRIADLLLDWLDALGVEKMSLVGHSMGGQIAVHLAARAPDRLERLILVDSAGIPRNFSVRSLARFAAEIAPLWRWGDPTFLPVIAADAWAAGPRVLLQSIRNILDDDVRPLLPTIQTPTLIVWGERDSLVPLRDAEEFRRLLPHSQLALLSAAAHNSMIDRPAAFNRMVSHFLNGEDVGR